ncbi:beta-ketoacyl synthase N-terminal-like domain-containing protein [Actinoplanes sp. NPDC051411]|uniref:beta-ketoacyl synthase N-terminal-like domain-containing protein n=1 Tax=Actinoplanes sp. NPDC051411 TaxID=3155522 RepID=UPI003420414B
MSRRAVITGLGVMAPSGVTAEEHWSTVASRTNRLDRISAFDASGYTTTVAGEVRGLDDLTRDIPNRLTVQTDRWTWMAFVAVERALADARLDLDAEDPYQVSVVLASSSGGNHFGQRELQRLWSQPERTVGAFQSIAWFYAATVGQLSIRHQAKGPSNVLVAESAGGLDSLAHSARLIARGVDVVLAGGLEAPLSPYALTCQLGSGRLSPVADPARAYLPFDAAASGYVPGEGGAVLVVEELEHAVGRGATIYAEVAGWSATHDGVLPGGPDGVPHQQYARALREAIGNAGLAPEDIDLVVPDAQGVLDQDRAEAAAIRAVFGPARPPVSSAKSLIGRLYQGGAALDAATAVLAMRAGQIPAHSGTGRPAEGCDLDFVAGTRPARLEAALIAARGYGGYNSAVVLRRHPGTAADNGRTAS